MRRCLCILIFWLGVSTAVSDAAEVLLGVVDKVDRDQGTVTLNVIDSSGGDNGQTVPESMTIAVDPDKIPAGLGQGDTVRVWGTHDTDRGQAIFRAESIHRGFSGNRWNNDPTGVRSRLRRGGQGGQTGSGRSSGKR